MGFCVKSKQCASPQSKEEEERNQEMLQWIMKRIDRQKTEEFMLELEQKYPKK
jgi:hypothetical protein